MNRFALILAVSVLFSGCTTTPTGQRVPNVALMRSTANVAVFTGTSFWLKDHPEDKPQFELARTAIRGLIAAGTFSAADLTTALRNLPIRELKGDSGTLIVGAAVSLWDAYGQQLASLDKAQVFATYILPVAASIADGLDQALGPPQPKPAQ